MSEGLFVKEWRKIGMRDMQKKQISDKRYSDKTYVYAIAYRVSSSSSEYQQFEEEVAISGETKATYVRNALTRKLTKDRLPAAQRRITEQGMERLSFADSLFLMRKFSKKCCAIRCCSDSIVFPYQP